MFDNPQPLNPNDVVVSWIGHNNERREFIMTTEQARAHWDKLAQAHRETYSIRPYDGEDVG